MAQIAKYKKAVFWQLLIFILPFIIYIGSFKNDFTAGDDQNIVLNNIFLRDWKYLPKFFTENFVAGSGTLTNYWRPFQLIVCSLIVHTVGIKGWAFHLSSILFHSLCGLLIFAIFSRLMYRYAKPAIIASMVLLWLALPIHAEELAGTLGIASPSHLFWILLGLFSFLIFEERKQRHWYFVSLSSFIFALFSKESAIVFPGLLLGMHITCIKAGLCNKIKIKDYIYRHFAFWLVASFYIVARLTFLNFNNTLNFYKEANIFTQNLPYRFFTLFTVLTHGLRIIFLPWGLHPERSWPVFTSLLSLNVILSLLILAAIFIAAVVSRRRNPLFSFGIFWFFLAYLPMSNIVAQINAVVCDHWFYTPSVGIFLSIASLLLLIKNNFYQRAFLIFLAAVITVFSILTFSLVPRWKNTESLCRFILSYEPHSAKHWNNLAMGLSDRKEDKGAIECYLRAIEISDTYPETHHNLANLYFDLGKYDLAEKEFLAAILLDSRFYRAYLGLGNIGLLQGKTGDAVQYFKKALEIYPYLPSQAIDFIHKFSSGQAD